MNILAFLGTALTSPLTKLLNGLEPHAKEPAQPAVAAAKVNPTLENVAAAVEAVTDPLIKDGITAVVGAIPILGPALANGAAVEALSAEHAILQGLVDALSKYLPEPVAQPAA